MVTRDEYNETVAWQCDACNLHYDTKTLAQECEEYCRSQDGCSADITKQSLERQQATET